MANLCSAAVVILRGVAVHGPIMYMHIIIILLLGCMRCTVECTLHMTMTLIHNWSTL